MTPCNLSIFIEPFSHSVIGGGAVVPTIVLAVVLVYGLWMLPDLVARAPEGTLIITVAGEQWWVWKPDSSRGR